MANVSVWPALGTTVTMDDGVTVVTEDGAVLTLTSEVRDKLRRGVLLTRDPRPSPSDEVPTPSTPITQGVPLTVVDLFSRRGNIQGETALTNNYDTGNARGSGEFYWDGASTATHNGGTVVGTYDVGRWRRKFSGAVDVTWFGARGDGVTDDTDEIQAAIDYAIAASVGEVWLPYGIYQISRTLHLGKSGGFTSITLRGQGGYNYDVTTAFPGTAIRATHSDSPAIAISGGRSSAVRDIGIVGALRTWIIGRNLGGILNTTYSDTESTDWNDPSLSANADSQYTPYAAIAIDGWAGVEPATHYPTTYRAYGQPTSFDTLIENVMVDGFTVGLAIQPSDVSANGDFTCIRRSLFRYVKWGISIGNDQSRNTSISDVKASNFYRMFTTKRHGRQNGKLGGFIHDLSTAAGIAWLDLNSSSIYGPLRFTNCYAEGLWRIGDVTHTTSTETGLEFDSCIFSMGGQTATRGSPATILSGGTNAGNVRFVNTAFTNYPSALSFDVRDIVFDGVTPVPSERGSSAGKSYLAAFHNATAGGLIPRQLRTESARHRIVLRQYNIDTAATSATVMVQPGMRETDRTVCLSVWAQNVATRFGNKDEAPVYRGFSAIAKTSLSSLTFTQSATLPGELTLVFSSLSDANAARNAQEPGDVIWDDQTGMVFAIRSRTTTTVIAEAQNNYKKPTGSDYTTVSAFSTTAGNLYFLNSRLFTPTYPLIADVTSGSPTLAVAGRDDNYSGFLESDIAVGDRIAVDEFADRYIAVATNRVTARDNSAQTITIDGNALRTVERKRITTFVRAAPANSAVR